jgi:hypothetical protein
MLWSLPAPQSSLRRCRFPTHEIVERLPGFVCNEFHHSCVIVEAEDQCCVPNEVIDPDGKWIVLVDFKLAQMVIATGPPVPNGNKIIPDFSFWHQLDRDGVGAPVCNRDANGECEFAEDFSAASAYLFHNDSCILFLLHELPVLREIGCRYFLFPAVRARAEQHSFTQVGGNG